MRSPLRLRQRQAPMMAPHPAPAEALSTAPVVELFDNCSERLAECKWDPSIDDLASANFAPPWLSPAFVSATTCPIIVTFEDISGTGLPVYLAAQSVSLRLKGVDGMGWYAVRNTMDHEMVSRMDGAAVRHKKGSAGYHRALTRYSERFRYELPDAEPGWVIIGDGQSGMAGGAKNANDARGLETASNNLSFMKDGTMVVNAPTTSCVPGLCPSLTSPSPCAWSIASSTGTMVQSSPRGMRWKAQRATALRASSTASLLMYLKTSTRMCLECFLRRLTKSGPI